MRDCFNTYFTPIALCHVIFIYFVFFYILRTEELLSVLPSDFIYPIDVLIIRLLLI